MLEKCSPVFKNLMSLCGAPFLNRMDSLTSIKNVKPFYTGKRCKYNMTFATNYRMLSTNIDDTETDDCNELDEEPFKELIKKGFQIPEMGHQVFVIQPFIKWGSLKKHQTKPVYQVNESVALIETLEDWKVVDKEIIALMSFNKTSFFGKGNLEILKDRIHNNKSITAVFLSVKLLNRLQEQFLEKYFGVPVYDRYNIVVEIFRRHAVTKEAKLQVAMAEIPYMWYRIKSVEDKGGGGVASIGGSGETLLEVRKRLLSEREQKIKKALKKLEIHRTLLRKKRKKKELPVIAVVGYTNAGKTSLIKALTEEDNLKPKNKLFATLDVTMHSGFLPSNVKVLFVDTIGFISDIPTELIEPFNVTLEDAVQSDILIHVLDVSNPDIIAQAAHVMGTLRRLKLDESLLNNIINVGNKCDIISENNLNNLEMSSLKDLIYVSSVEKKNIYNLRNRIERVLLKVSGRIPMKIRVPNGGSEFKWLYKESSVVSITTDDRDSQYVYMNVIITESSLSKFKYEFIYSKNCR